MFTKVGDITGRHYNAQNSDVSFPHTPHRLEGGDVLHFRLGLPSTLLKKSKHTVFVAGGNKFNLQHFAYNFKIKQTCLRWHRLQVVPHFPQRQLSKSQERKYTNTESLGHHKHL